MQRFYDVVQESWRSVESPDVGAANHEQVHTLGLALLDIAIAMCRLMKILLRSSAGP
jgi:hypothetical protein